MKNRAIIYLLLLIPSISFAQSRIDSLTDQLNAFHNEKAFVGFAVGVFDQDSIIYSNGFGYSNKELEVPYTINTIQPIASISKTVIGVLLMKAQELGKLKIDDDINKYLPFKITNPYHPERVITIRQLANHTSTLKEPHYLQSYIFEDELPDLHDVLERGRTRKMARLDVKERNRFATKESGRIDIITFIKERFHPSGKYFKKRNFVNSIPGEEYYYSNEGAALVAYIIEKATGQNFTDFSNDHVFFPLKMTNTSWDHKSMDGSQNRSRSELYYFGQKIPRYEGITYPDGGLASSVSDFSSYMITMMNGYNGMNNILNADSYKSMMDKFQELDEEAIFWENDTKYEGYIGYSGQDMGILTIAHFFKEEKRGIVIFSNTSHLDGLGQDLIELFFILKAFSDEYVELD